MTTPTEPLSFNKLDANVTVWGVAALFDLGIFAVVAERSREDAVIAAGLAASYEPDDAPSIADQLVYHHPDHGWVYASTGHRCRTI